MDGDGSAKWQGRDQPFVSRQRMQRAVIDSKSWQTKARFGGLFH
jgi:hypothetical protein